MHACLVVEVAIIVVVPEIAVIVVVVTSRLVVVIGIVHSCGT